MNLFYEDGGAFKVGKVLQEQGNAYQVETLHGKRTKVKASSVMISFIPARGAGDVGGHGGGKGRPSR